jgi:hypothetical protein
MCVARRLFALVLTWLPVAVFEAAIAHDLPTVQPKSTSRSQPSISGAAEPARLKAVAATSVDDGELQRQIARALSQWEAASEAVVSPSGEDEHVAYLIHKSTSSGHEIAVALEFQKPVRADELLKKYRWTRIDATDEALFLFAEPIDEVDRLFYRGFEVELDSETSLPVAVRFTDRKGKPKPASIELAVKTRSTLGERDVQLTSAEVAASSRHRRVARKPPEEKLTERDGQHRTGDRYRARRTRERAERPTPLEGELPVVAPKP